MDQNTCRVDRDGQEKPVFSYILLAQDGSDPVIADVLGIKAQQQRGIRDPSAGDSAADPLKGADAGRAKTLAIAFLKKHNPALLAKTLQEREDAAKKREEDREAKKAAKAEARAAVRAADTEKQVALPIPSLPTPTAPTPPPIQQSLWAQLAKRA